MIPKIFIVEDDCTIRTELETLLTGNGYHVFSVTDFSKTIQQVKTENPQLILLDIKLPQESGFSLCSGIRSFSDVPIIFVTSCSTDMDELSSIMLGGDAFITKPYNTAILLAKIASLLKKSCPKTEQEILVYQGATLHLGSSQIEYDGHTVELTKDECNPLFPL